MQAGGTSGVGASPDATAAVESPASGAAAPPASAAATGGGGGSLPRREEAGLRAERAIGHAIADGAFPVRFTLAPDEVTTTDQPTPRLVRDNPYPGPHPPSWRLAARFAACWPQGCRP